MDTLNTKLAEIQRKLIAPKSQTNAFGKYKYRSCEDILEALKKLLNGLVLTLSDEIVNIGDRYYVKATASITDGSQTIKCESFAREEESKKGMDGAQVTGAASSYARKYALNGLFCIDDTKDSDHTNNGTESNEVISLKQLAEIGTYIENLGVDEAKFLSFMKVDKLSSIQKSQYNKAIEALKAKEAQVANS